MSVLEIVYVGAALLLAMYALNSWILTFLFLRHRQDSEPRPELQHFPRVTVQLPIFNESLVVERLIDSVVQLDWPRDRLQIQVLDDSTDETTAIAQARVDALRAQGVDKGSIQCLKKLVRPVTVARLPFIVRWQALVHLSTYLIHPLMLTLLLVSLPLMLIAGHLHRSLGFFSLVSLGPPLMFAVSQRTLYPRSWLKHYAFTPVLVLLGIGVALSNTRAVIEALLGVDNVFRRTPKFRIEARSDRWRESQYALPLDGMVIGELALTVYALAAVVAALWHGNMYTVPFLLLYVGGFGYVGLLGLWDARLDLILWFRRLLGDKPPPQRHEASPRQVIAPGRHS